jgi:hypothetical protein
VKVVLCLPSAFPVGGPLSFLSLSRQMSSIQKKMLTTMEVHLFLLFVFNLTCLSVGCKMITPTRMECTGGVKVLECSDKALVTVETLVLKRVYLKDVTISPDCLPRLQRIFLLHVRNADCSLFLGFNTTINGENCQTETVSFFFFFFFFFFD